MEALGKLTGRAGTLLCTLDVSESVTEGDTHSSEGVPPITYRATVEGERVFTCENGVYGSMKKPDEVAEYESQVNLTARDCFRRFVARWGDGDPHRYRIRRETGRSSYSVSEHKTLEVGEAFSFVPNNVKTSSRRVLVMRIQ